MNQKSNFDINSQARSFKLFLDRFILSPKVRNSIEKISKHSSVYIFSGIIRDFLTGVIDVVRDCDIVINPGQAFKIPVSLLRKARYERNQFGGLKIMGDDMSLDVWFLENTWGIVKEGDIPEVDSLLKRTFFNFSSIVFDYTNEKFIYTEEFVVFLQTNTMEVVYPLNPNNELCIVNKFYFSDNGILSLFLSKDDTALFENIVAIFLHEKFGDRLYYLKSSKTKLDIDFFIPEENVAVQACYSIEKQETFDREVSQLVRLNEKENGKYKLYIVTKEDKRELFVKGNKIEVISLTDFLLGRK